MMSTDPSKAFFEFWAAQGEALVKAQEHGTKVFTEGLQAMSSGALPFPQLGGSAPDVAASTADMERAGKSFAELWSAATALSASLAKTVPSVSSGDKTAETTLFKMFDPSTWMGGTGEMDDVLARMAEGPRFADLWEIERRYARVVSAWMNVRRVNVEHQAVVLEAWMVAGRRFTDLMKERTPSEAQEQDAKAALALWTDTANKQLLEAQRSAPFLRTQAAMIRATTDLRLAQQDMMEHFGKQYGFPTRNELDDVHRSVTEMRRELRAMRRAQRVPAPRPEPALATVPTHD